jgi:hypothetical protein
METLIPDFMSKWDLLYQVIDEKPEVVSHNMETVKRLYRKVRPQAKYERSLEQILKTKERGRRTKSGIMLGLGETEAEVLEIMDDAMCLRLVNIYNLQKCIWQLKPLSLRSNLIFTKLQDSKKDLNMLSLELWFVHRTTQNAIFSRS